MRMPASTCDARRSMNRTDDVVSAAEIASFAWCPESWRLDALWAQPGNQEALRCFDAELQRLPALLYHNFNCLLNGIEFMAEPVIRSVEHVYLEVGYVLS